ncbi:DNA primase small subunit [Sesamum angolense]|uniref:DNA primase n=1 Tax=Sesamum angolense TaxID=2727404 RepID=A0AAE1T5H9_9LAMI|nr:DNA primase small subunit [Sesamum angolense]
MVREEFDNMGEDMVIDGAGTEQKPSSEFPDGFNANYLKIYYGKLFPYADMHKWMSYGNDDFGFNHILWVYSGRRGVHCWVCDGKARRLNNEQRAGITEYLHVHKGNEIALKRRSYAEVLKDFFEEKYILSQNLFSDEERYEKILEMIPDESTTSELRGKWLDNKRSRDDINVVRWGQLKHMLQSGKQKVQGIHRSVEEIVFSFTYPRLDLEVSKHMNHLLKAPFCVHPKTGRVCVPIDPKHCEEFDPSAVPTLSKLLEELNMGASGTGGEEELENTSLGKSIRYFRSSFLQPLLKSCKEASNSRF